MKKSVLFFLAAMTLSVASAQVKLDAEGLRKKVAAADANVQDAKKAARAQTWIDRGNAYFQAAVAPDASLYKSMDQANVTLLCGKPGETTTKEIGGQKYSVQVFENYDLYIPEGDTKVAFWIVKTEVVPNGLGVAMDSYHKAVELDPKTASKVKPLAIKVADTYKQEADIEFSASQYKEAAHAFSAAYDISADPIVNAPDTLSAYNAGYVGILAEEYDSALKYLDAAQKLDYDQDGELYFLYYHAYNGKKDTLAAENALKTGVQKYPANSKLIESLILHYTTTGQDASQMIPMVEDALKKDPDNFVFHFGLGMIYDKLGNFEKAVEEFGNSAKLAPTDYSSMYNLGITYIRWGESMGKELSDIPVSKQAEYDAKLAEINTLFKKSLAPLQKAHELNPQDRNAVDLLKSLYFRFRDESPEMMQNYEKYNQMLQTMD
ncbi:MAG: tetratricopeptide repeat protein [Rikenellaceae bacterium]|jgi:tetratricopeptide (TPR) repeat protein|nr:tetratricopeptide repeat protein [Rikenellaceae bacterium]